MIVQELKDVAKELWNNGEKTSAGQSSQSSKIKSTVTVQYPSERSAGNDATGNLRVHDLYKNGLLFTAYDMNSRTSSDMRNMRLGELRRTAQDIVKSITGKNTKQVDKIPVANILLPRSKSDVDATSHKFNDVADSLITRGGGTATGVLSNIASTAVFGALESVTQGLMADNNEQIYTTARSMYAGADNRTKVFTWDLTPRSVHDLIAIVEIYEYFNYYSYGETGNSTFAKEVKSTLDEWYKSTFLDTLTPTGAQQNDTVFEKITSFLSNVIVVSNPTIWYVRNFGNTSKFDGKTDIFGPCQIQSIRFDKTPNGQFNGLSVAPNLPSTFTLEITMREILTLNRSSLYSEAF
ncbi:baseplate tail tube cap [Salmonella phage vB_SnwM_CGG4-1]|uniref:Baseplate tail tube cap n=1 Tax=Salmonella phage vB_SnwM_CGG4-1 TaxID=1815631 RepID=A0A1B0VVD3_9CAUD|nr:baseplate tail tube cap [Salmonella phage vB_SnwM_CGG4-1]ANA49537.1 baseplate tail tube cap [Salmonella phage vB_SnwM_CGG4-1]